MVDLECLVPLAGVVQSSLIAELNVFGDDAQARCRDFLDEDPGTAETRKDLSVRKARLGDAKLAIRKFKMK
jgi:hypothetical protein